MVLPVLVARDAATGRRFFSLGLGELAQWPVDLSGVTAPFGLLLVCDVSGERTSALATVAEKALASGAAYIAAWGPDCERVHDIFDETLISLFLNRGDTGTVVTTWHAHESLDDAVWFFVHVPRIDTGKDLSDWLAVTVGRPAWEQRIQQRLTNLSDR